METSALVAIVLDEPSAGQLAGAIYAAEVRLTSAASLLEASIVLQLRGRQAAVDSLDQLTTDMRIAVIPFDEDQVHLARDAYRDFGKGSGHGARLNFGDCCAYALARITGEPLLCTGDDFGKTGIPLVDWRE